MLPIRRRLYQSLAGFTPRQLFAALQGAWLEPTPGYIWQENTGVTPTTTGGQTIGLVLDQSQGAVLEPELLTNGTFEAGITGWTRTDASVTLAWDSTNKALQITFTNPTTGAFATFSTTPGCLYEVTGSVISSSVTAETMMRVGNGSVPDLGLGESTYSTAPGTRTVRFIATGTTSYVYLRLRSGSSVQATWDNISVRQILGNHASQSVSGSRPTYQLDSNSLPLARHDTTDSLSVSLPNLGGGVYSAAGSVYFATPAGMSALHNQSMGTTYTLPALSTDIYSWIVVPQRLNTALEGRLERYMLRKAGLAVPDYLTDDFGETITDDIGDPILAG